MRIAHIGYPKTATTFLQKQVFPKIDGVDYVRQAEIKPALIAIRHDDESMFDIDACRAVLDSAFSKDLPIQLISHEPLTGMEMYGRFVNRTQIAHRLKALAFDRVIITIRNQREAMESSYRQYIKSGGVLTHQRFYSIGHIGTNHRIDWAYFDYYRIAALYARLFGASNVCILQYETLQAKPLDFIVDLCAFLERPVPSEIPLTGVENRSLSKRACQFLRILNHLTYNAHRPSHLISRKISTRRMYRLLRRTVDPWSNAQKTFANDAFKERVTAHFSESNKQLAQAFDIELNPAYYT